MGQPRSTAVSIMIPTKNGAATIGGCLEMIFKQRYEAPFEVIVVDSGSTDRTVAIAESFPLRLVKIRPEEFNHGGTRNSGAALSQGEIVVFLNQDAEPTDEHWLRHLVRAALPEHVAGAYSRQLPRPGAFPMEEFFLQFMYPEKAPAKTLDRAQPALHSTFFSTVSGAVKREILEQEPFRSDIPMTEDNEWSVRVVKKGYEIAYCPESKVYHTHNYTIHQAYRRFFDAGMTARLSYLKDNRRNWINVTATGLNYLGREARYLVNSGHDRWLPFAALYEGAKFGGYALGLTYPFLPDWVLRKSSANLKDAAKPR